MLIARSVIYGLLFMAAQLVTMEEALHGNPHTAFSYALNETLGYSALTCHPLRRTGRCNLARVTHEPIVEPILQSVYTVRPGRLLAHQRFPICCRSVFSPYLRGRMFVRHQNQ